MLQSQTLRLVNLLLVGPLVFWGGRKVADNGEDLRGSLLMLLGAGTVVYNGSNYLAHSRGKRRRL
jgi:hypothetical protein